MKELDTAFLNRDILSIDEFSKEELMHVLKTAEQFIDQRNHAHLLPGKIMATLFFEPSTRTRLSFEAAMKRLGGSVIGFSDWKDSSVMKGEDLIDTITVVDGYADVIVMRHPQDGSAALAAKHAKCPVINGGDGSNQHPTQTFLDLFTIQREHGSFDNLTVGFLGDLKYGRTVHSLATALAHFPVKMYFISPESLRMPKKLLEHLSKKAECHEAADVMEVASKLDIVYATRIQQERFQFEEDFRRVKGSYHLDKKFLANAKPNVKIMHPLPRVGEIKHEIDETPNALYFKQAHYGLPVRMALLNLVLGASR